LKESKILQHVLGLVLFLGNKMNDASAKGFRIDSLLKLADVRANVGQDLTMLHYVAALTRKKFADDERVRGAATSADMPPWSTLLPAVFRARTVSLAAARTALGASLAQLERAVTAVDAHELLDVRQRWSDELAAAGDVLRRVTAEQDKASALFAECCQYFAEPAATEPTDLFAVLCTFFSQFDRAVAHVEHERERATKAAARQRVLPRVSPSKSKNRKNAAATRAN
jgi:hypothetical protein